jgi:hypothetical protein
MSQHREDPEWRLGYWGRHLTSLLPLWARMQGHLGVILRAELPLRGKLDLLFYLLKEFKSQQHLLWGELQNALSPARSWI